VSAELKAVRPPRLYGVRVLFGACGIGQMMKAKLGGSSSQGRFRSSASRRQLPEGPADAARECALPIRRARWS
jgi:hypothetical protein